MSPLVFRIVRHDGAWAVEHEGRFSNRSTDKAVVMASASKLARAATTAGRPAMVKVESDADGF